MNSRRHGRPLLVYALTVLVIVAGGYLCFELGRYQGGYSVLDHRRDVAEYADRVAAQQTAADELRRRLAILETSKEIDKETYSRVEANLADLQARIQAQEEELVFYRGIVSPKDGVAGLRIETLEVTPTDAERRYTIRLVLVQAIVHSKRVAGSVKLQLEGTREGQMASLDVADLVAGDSRYDMAYEFRYFQGLESEFVLPLGFEPQHVQVEISPTEPRGDHVTESFEWSAVTGD